MGPWLVVFAIAFFLIVPAAVHAWRVRKAERCLEAETTVRLEEEGEADVQPHEALKAIEKLLDVPGVSAVYSRGSSNLLYALLVPGLTERELRGTRDAVRYTTPIGLSTMVVTDKAAIPDGCVMVARGWAA